MRQLTRPTFQRRQDAVCSLITRIEGDLLTLAKQTTRCCENPRRRATELGAIRYQFELLLAKAQAICTVHGEMLERTGRERFIHRIFTAIDAVNDELDRADAALERQDP